MTKYIALSLAFFALFFVSPVMASSEEDSAVSFIKELGDQAIEVISNKEMDESGKKERFSSILESYFDIKSIGRFAMGHHWRKATDEQKGEYFKLFKSMIVSVYTERFSDYTNERLEVLKAEKVNRKDMIVASQIVFGDDGARPPLKLDWRVRKRDEGLKVIDLSVEGVSMSVTQRSDFSSIIQRKGEVEALLAELRERY